MNNFLVAIIIGFMIILLVQREGCSKSSSIQKIDTLVKHDTIWKRYDSLVVRKTKITSVIHDTLPIEYIADTNYSLLKAQYDTLVKSYLAKNVYLDTLKLDDIGYVVIADTVHKNILSGIYKYNYKIPTVTNTITIIKEAPNKSQLYFGGGLDFNQIKGVQSVRAGLLLKTKKDHIYNLNIGAINGGGIIYGVSSYWKVKLK